VHQEKSIYNGFMLRLSKINPTIKCGEVMKSCYSGQNVGIKIESIII
jgi:hypothetical protein